MFPNLSGWFTDNLGIKLLALLLALAVYAHVYTEQEQEWQVRVPLQVSGLSPNLILVNPLPDAVEVNARGKGKQLLKFKMQDPKLVVQLGSVRPGSVQRMLSPTDVDLPVGVDATVTEILRPRMLELAVDTLVSRDVEVRVTLAGDLDENLALYGAVRPSPSRVTVRGPSRVIARTAFIGTEPLHLEELRGAGGFELAVIPDTITVSAAPGTVRVEVPVVDMVERAVPARPVVLDHLPAGLRLVTQPDLAMALLRGPAPVVDSLQAAGVLLTVDVSGLGPGRHLLPPEVVMVDRRVHALSVQPARILVELVRSTP